MERILSTAQACISGYDVAFSRAVRLEDRAWRGEDLAHRELERQLLHEEAKFMQEERRFLHTQIQQAHVENARSLWLRFVDRNRTEVMEKTEQLKAVSSLSALLAGFALVGFLEFQFVVSENYNKALLPLFALTTSITVGVEVAAVVLTSLMLANILRTAKSYVNEQEEAEFMHRCQAFMANYRPGDRPPAPVRTFAVHWARRCEHEWRIAFRLFSTGIPFFFVNLALAGWIKFHDAQTPVAPIIVTLIMGFSLMYNVYTHRKWGEYLMADGSEDAQEVGNQLIQPPVGLPFDWYLPPLSIAGGLELRSRPAAVSDAGASNDARAVVDAAGGRNAAEYGMGASPVDDGPGDGNPVARGAVRTHERFSCASRSLSARCNWRGTTLGVCRCEPVPRRRVLPPRANCPCHQLAALNAKAVKAWLQDASWKGRANKNNPRFYADVPADDSGPFAAIRKAIRDAINKAERKKRQKGKKCALVKMYAIFTKTGGFHAPHGDGSRGGMAGYKLRYVMKVGGTGKTGRIHLKMKGEEEMAYEYEAAYSMDAATGSSPNKHRVAHKAKMSAARKGKKHTAAHKAKISAAMKGKKHTAAHKAKISAAMKGNTNRMKKR